ncbi:DNA repair protein, partial [Carbonactinospora thermoautotrophica]
MGEPLVTFGHGTARPDEIVRLLRQAGVRELVDIRIAPGSRHNPQASRAEL